MDLNKGQTLKDALDEMEAMRDKALAVPPEFIGIDPGAKGGDWSGEIEIRQGEIIRRINKRLEDGKFVEQFKELMKPAAEAFKKELEKYLKPEEKR